MPPKAVAGRKGITNPVGTSSAENVIPMKTASSSSSLPSPPMSAPSSSGHVTPHKKSSLTMASSPVTSSVSNHHHKAGSASASTTKKPLSKALPVGGFDNDDGLWKDVTKGIASLANKDGSFHKEASPEFLEELLRRRLSLQSGFARPPAGPTTSFLGPSSFTDGHGHEKEPIYGRVRGTPYGANLRRPDDVGFHGKDPKEREQERLRLREDGRRWQRKLEALPALDFPIEGFDHTYGPSTVEFVDAVHHEKPKGRYPDGGGDGRRRRHDGTNEEKKDDFGMGARGTGSGDRSGTLWTTKEDDDDDAGATEAARQAMAVAFGGGTKFGRSTSDAMPRDGNEYGSDKSPLDAPVRSLRDKWRMIPHFLALRSLMRQHIDSFDYLINVDMKKIVESPSACEIRSDFDARFYLRYTDCWVGEPVVEEDSYEVKPITPFQCRLRDCTYSAPIYVNVRYTRGRQIVKKSKVSIGKIPIMLRSSKCLLHGKTERQLMAMKECPYDPGGYFVVKGVEKVILMQEQLSKNRVILEEDGKGFISAAITSSTHERKSRCNIFVKNGCIYLKSNVLDKDVPITVVMKGLGLESDLEMAQTVGSEPEIMDFLSLSIEQTFELGVSTQIQALKYLGSHLKGGPPSSTGYSKRPKKSPQDEARDVLSYSILSHVPVHNFDFRNKALYVAHIVRRVILVTLGQQDLDDKDYYGNKRLELAGDMMSLLFEDLFKGFNRVVKKNADNVLSKRNQAQAFDVVKHLPTDLITQGMIQAISTGNWVLRRFRMERAGVTQVLSRLSYLGALGMITRVNSQFEKTQKVSGPRALQPSQWGMLCPSDTPEGESCGLVKNLALLAHVTTEEDPAPVERLCRDLGVENAHTLSGNELNALGAYLVMLNGLIVGVHSRPRQFVKNLRSLRRQGQAGEFVSFYMHEGHKCVYIATDGGRVCRPLVIVDEATGRPRLRQAHLEGLVLKTITIQDLLKQGVVEYVDVNEENNCLIAVKEQELEVARERDRLLNKQLSAQLRQGQGQGRRKGKRKGKQHQQQQQQQQEHDLQAVKHHMPYTHMEVDPLSLLGVVAGIIPNPHHNQSPRNTYQSAMGKQAMGGIAMNEYERMDGLIYTLIYPMKPMVKTRTIDIINFDQLPGGQNACIAVMSYSGYDIEDAVVINKASIDRGFGRCMVLKKHQASVRRYGNGTIDRTVGPPDPSAFVDGADDIRYRRYRALDHDGICMPGEHLPNGSLMVNKESPEDTDGGGVGKGANSDLFPNAVQNVAYKPSGLTYRSSAPATVDKVVVTSNEFEHFLIKVMVRQIRRPELGDKFASRHGQKGVCGLIAPQTDLPFNEFGFAPDLIMNPHGFPSRMTVGKLIELLVGKAGIFYGRRAYASAFGEEFGSTDTAATASEALIRMGINYVGKDCYYSGAIGRPLDAYVFSGPVFYQKLKHMVLDKMHARARGPRAVLTRQPTEGRARDGGLRLGEMERDCLIAYGASNLIMERLMHSSDAFQASVCMQCGLLQTEGWCQNCRTGEKVADIRLPYACKLLFQELQSMNVAPRLRLEDV